VFEIKNGCEMEIEEKVVENKVNGLKAARIIIAKLLQSNNYPPDLIVPHLCKKSGRPKDAWNRWPVSRYME